MPHVLVAGKIHDAGCALLRATPGITFDLVEEVSTESYAPLVGEADAILIRTQPMPADVVGQADRLKIVSRHGVGFDAVDVEALNRRGIPLAIVGDVNSRTVAEHTLMMMLSIAKRATQYDAATRGGGWGYRNSFAATELAGRTLFLIGFGRIGRTVAKMAAGFDMEIYAHDPFVGDADIRQSGAIPVREIGLMLESADYVSIHMPLSDGGTIIGAMELARMKRNAVIINTARGGLVDEEALAAALDEGRLGGAGLDVFSEEPPSANHPLFHSERTILSPHSAGLTEECAARMSTTAVQNILDFFVGKLDPNLIVNAAALTQFSDAKQHRA